MIRDTLLLSSMYSILSSGVLGSIGKYDLPVLSIPRIVIIKSADFFIITAIISLDLPCSQTFNDILKDKLDNSEYV